MSDHMAMFRRGEISSRQAGKLGILKQTRVNRPNEEDFDGKQGLADQGGRRDRGAKVATTRHINTKQGMGSPATASGKPSGMAKAFQRQPTRVAHIDATALQKPDFPGGGKAALAKPAVASRPPGGGKPAMGMAKAPGTPSRAKGRIAARGGQYGGGGRNTQ